MQISKQQEQEIIRIYTEEKRGQLYCAQKVLGVKNPKYVKDVLKKNKIHIRSYGEAASVSNKNRIKYTSKDLDFFQKESSDMAWILGFIASDGTIRKNSNEIKIGLSIKDVDVLEKIKRAIKLDEPIKYYTTKTGFDCCGLKWTCEEHKKQLAKYSIVPAKTFQLKPPYRLDKKYWIDYIRGYFDGDGSINFIEVNGKKHYTALRWQVCSATKDILQFIVDYFEDEYDIPPVNIQVRKSQKHHLYSIQYSTNSTKKIYKILYPENCLYLDRKKNKFEESIRKISK